jgi:hypothetical protein
MSVIEGWNGSGGQRARYFSSSGFLSSGFLVPARPAPSTEIDLAPFASSSAVARAVGRSAGRSRPFFFLAKRPADFLGFLQGGLHILVEGCILKKQNHLAIRALA